MARARVVEFRDLGTVAYGECWRLQQQLFEGLIERKKGSGSCVSQEQEADDDRAEEGIEEAAEEAAEDKNTGYILMVEHPAVYTLGKSGKSSNILFSEEQLKAIGADYYHIDRGGDVTFHGEGQIVLYPILDLEAVGIGLKEYIWALEQAVIETVAHWGVEAERIAGAAGVWIVKRASRSKICAIGVRSSRYITMHGLAMNVRTDLKYFNYINPCGFTDRGVTSLEVETSSPVSMNEAKELLLNNLIKILNVKIYKK
ncbi:MAG: lipoyl(octanoyl) transferase LipB [Rikenellaceae bacterium]